MLAEDNSSRTAPCSSLVPFTFPPAGKTAISFPAGPLTQIIPDPNEQHYQCSKGEVKEDGTAGACSTKEYANQQLCPSNGS